MIIIRGATGFSCCFQQERRKGGSASEEITYTDTACQGSFPGVLGHRDAFSGPDDLLSSGS